MLDLAKIPSPKGQVDLLETVGKGNFGFVYRGRMTETKEISAVKVVFLKEEELREILLEVEILRDCSHKNIVKLLGHFKKETDLWICMEFCGGGAVDTLYKNLQRQLNETEIGILIGECLRGLVYLHEEMHIIHRDIKSGNMLLTETGEVKLADFGVSALTIKVREYRANSFIGTPYWMAPEVILVENSRTETYDCKADIWSIGITCIELADKNPPLSDIHPMRALYLIPTASPTSLMLQQPQKWSKPFVAFIQSCLVKDPHRRISALECFHTPYLEKVSDTAGQNGGTKKIMLDLIQEVRGHKLGIKNSTKQEPVKKDDSSDEQFANFDLESNSTEKSDIKSTSSSTNRKNSSGFLRFFRNSTTDYIPLFLSIEESVISIVKQSERFNDIVPLFESNMKVNSSDIISFTALKAGNPFVYTFLLLAGEKNIFACDISEKSDYIYADGSDRLRLLIPEAKVKEIIIVEDYGIMLARGGRRNEIRQYRLQSIIKLLLHVFKIDSPGDEDYNIEDSLFRRQSSIFWSKDYFKIVNTKESLSFVVLRTQLTIYMGVIFKNYAIIYEWAKIPYLKFMKVKEFWLPETPRSLEICHDGKLITDIIVLYKSEANRIEFESSRVIEIPVPETLSKQASEVSKDKEQNRWHTFQQIPSYNDLIPGQIAPSWQQTLKSMKPKAQGITDLSSVRLIATFGAKTSEIDGTGKLKGTTIQWSSSIVDTNDKELKTSAPESVVVIPDNYIVGIHKNYVEIQTFSGVTELVFKFSGNFRFATAFEGTGLGIRRRGRFYFMIYNKKTRNTQFYWIRETGYDYVDIEAKNRKMDKESKPSKVLGAIASKIEAFAQI